MMCLLEMVKMLFDGLCEHFTYIYIYIYARNMTATITYYYTSFIVTFMTYKSEPFTMRLA